MIVSVRLKGGPMSGYQASIREGQTRHTIRERVPAPDGPAMYPTETMPMDVMVSVRIGEYRQGATPGEFEWAGWL